MKSCQGPPKSLYPLSPKPLIVALVGPTASGKTAAALSIAKRFNGEIIVADSRQVYRGMDIGTNKVNAEPRGTVRGTTQKRIVDGIPYHGIDLVEPNEPFTVQQWKTYAIKTIAAIVARDHLPILEGGTGLYIWALLDNLTIPEVPPDPLFRTQVEHRITREGTQKIIEEILEADPEAAAFLQLNNPRRIIRAYEVIKKTGAPFSQQRGQGPKLFNDIRIGIDPGIEIVDRRIELRAKEQFAKGLENEADRLTERYGWNIPAMSGIGYAEWQEFLTHKTSSREDVLQQNITRNKQFARAQRKWFKRDKKIQWVKNKQEAFKKAEHFLSENM